MSLVTRSLKGFLTISSRYHFSRTVKSMPIIPRFHPMMWPERRPKVYVTRGDMPADALKVLSDYCDVETYPLGDMLSREELRQRVQEKDAILCFLTDKVDDDIIFWAGTQLKVIATVSVGYDHIDVEECKRRGIKVGHTPDVLTEATADLTVALLLAAARLILPASKAVTSGEWKSWRPFWMCGKELTDSTVGIVGLGRIGQAVLKRLRPFGVKRFIYYGRTELDPADNLGAEFVTFDKLVTESDFVIVCCSLNEDSKGMFTRWAFYKMKPSAIFVNTSRGPLIDQEALYDSLKDGNIWAAGLDVTDPEPLSPNHPLTTLPNCVILPHIGSSTEKTRNRMVMMTVENIIAGLTNKKMPGSVY